MVDRNRDPSQPAMPIYFNTCEGHQRMDAKVDRLESQQGELVKSVLQGQRDTLTRFGDVERKIDKNHERTTEKLDGLQDAVTRFLAHQEGIANGKAEVTAEITTKVRSFGKVAKWVAGVLAALAAGGGGVELLRRMIGGE